MATLFGMFPFLQKLFADGGYQGPEFSTALAKVRPHLNVEIVKPASGWRAGSGLAVSKPMSFTALARLGIRGFNPKLKKAVERLDGLRTREGEPIPPNTLAELKHDMERRRLVTAGLEGDSNPFDPMSCFLRFLPPAIEQFQQCALIDRELLQRRALDARHDTGDQPTRLAHLDHGD